MTLSTSPVRAVLKTSVAFTGLGLLAACGGGGGDDPIVSASEINPAIPVEVVLPFYGVDADGGTSGNILFRLDGSSGSMEVIDSDTVEISSTESGGPGSSLINYNADTGFWELEANTDFKFVLIDRGDYQGFFLAEAPDDLGFSPFANSGAFGVTSDTGTLTGSATFSSNSFARMLVTDDDAAVEDPPYYSIIGDGVNLTVTDLNDGSISGTVFDGSGLFDLDDAGGENDRLSLTVDMSGTISGAEFTGTVSGAAASVDLGNDGSVDINPTFTLSNTDLDGAFFGDGGQWAAGSWEADYELDPGGDEPPLTGEAIGFFEAEQD